MATSLRIVHRTEYRYDRPVAFGPHRLMVRPRDGHDMWVQDASLLIAPQAHLHWHFDTFGNSVAHAIFDDPADSLVIQSDLIITRYPIESRLAARDRQGTPYPFSYDTDERIDLAPLLPLQCPGDLPVLSRWLDTAFKDRPGEALALLEALSNAIHASFDYSQRDQLGTQTPAATITQGRGTCRDFAFLFMEAARSFGFAARFVTGYLHDQSGAVGGGATHAWAEAFIPGEGWVEFDPTNRIVAGGQLIRVAVTRTPAQASPISGSFAGKEAEFLGMEIAVSVSEAQGDETLS